METHSITEYNETLVTTIDLPERLTRAMEIFDLFLSFLTKEHPEGVSQVMEELETRLKEKAREPLDDKLRVKIEAFSGPLRDHPKHAELAQRAILTWMQYSNYKDQENLTSLRVFVKDFTRGFQFFSYWLARSITAIMSKSEAIEFYKRYIDYRIPITETGIKFADINHAYEFSKQFLSTGTHIVTMFKLKEGIAGMKITRCMGAELLEELEDPEFSYVIMCYGDFAAIKVYNENFRLTRTQTIAEGKPYCDFCYHDIRVDPTLKHPSKKFFDSL